MRRARPYPTKEAWKRYEETRDMEFRRGYADALKGKPFPGISHSGYVDGYKAGSQRVSNLTKSE